MFFTQTRQTETTDCSNRRVWETLVWCWDFSNKRTSSCQRITVQINYCECKTGLMETRLFTLTWGGFLLICLKNMLQNCDGNSLFHISKSHDIVCVSHVTSRNVRRINISVGISASNSLSQSLLTVWKCEPCESEFEGKHSADIGRSQATLRRRTSASKMPPFPRCTR